jgi:hypothetical protein
MFRSTILFVLLSGAVFSQTKKKDMQRMNDSLRIDNQRLHLANDQLKADYDSVVAEMNAIEQTNKVLIESSRKHEELTGILRSAMVQERNLSTIIFQYGDYGIGLYSIRVYEQWLRQNLSKMSFEEIDAAYITFREFYYNEINQYNEQLETLYPELNEWMNDGSDPEMKELMDRLQLCGSDLYQSEGFFYIDQRPDYFTSIFGQDGSSEMKEYLEIRSKELKEGFSEDAGLLISFEQLYDRVVVWEKYLAENPDFILNEEIKGTLSMYLSTLMTGMDNSPAFDYETGKLLPELQFIYSKAIQKNDNRNSTKVLRKYFEHLKANGFVQPLDMDAFLDGIGYYSMMGVQPPPR